MNSKGFVRWTLAANDPSGADAADSLLESSHRYGILAKALDRLLDEVASETLTRLKAAPPAQRQWRGIEAHLNACLKRPGIRRLTQALLECAGPARARQRHTRLTHLLRLARAGYPDRATEREPQILAAMVLEAEYAEHEIRRMSPEYRHALRRYLGMGPHARP